MPDVPQYDCEEVVVESPKKLSHQLPPLFELVLVFEFELLFELEPPNSESHHEPPVFPPDDDEDDDELDAGQHLKLVPPEHLPVR